MPIDYMMNKRHTALQAAEQAGSVDDCSGISAAPAKAKEGPTKAEFDKVVADLSETQATLNELLAALRAAGIMEK